MKRCNTDESCPDCSEPLDFDEVDISVGVQRGNPRCPNCGWEPRTKEEKQADDEYFRSGTRYPGQ
jgi:hypothetical protein